MAPIVLVSAEKERVAVDLVKNLVEKNCFIFIITNSKNFWNEKLLGFKSSLKIKIFSSSGQLSTYLSSTNLRVGYVFVFEDLQPHVLDIAVYHKSKTLIVSLSQTKELNIEKYKKEKELNYNLVFLSYGKADPGEELARTAFSYWILKRKLVLKVKIPEIIKEKNIERKKLNFLPKSNILPHFNKLFLISLTFLVLLLLSLPFVSITISSVGLGLAYKSGLKGNLELAVKYLSASDIFSSFAKETSIKFSKLPLLGKEFLTASNLAYLLEKASDIGKRGILVTKDISNLTSRILANEDYDINKISQKIYLETGVIYEDLSFLQSEIDKLPSSFKKTFPLVRHLTKVRSFLLGLENLSLKLPSILGKGKPTNYLVLFQNNMELRPTGGFIGSFGIAKFEEGKFTDITIYDVYAADGQLKGHIEPPLPIKKYLGEANWFLRDSNWNPDFPTSAREAEWFLDKEIDIKVDGVIAVDLEVARSILKVTGPLSLVDYERVVDYENLYQITQEEVESPFFPGSQKKTGFLTALARGILGRVRELKEKYYQDIAKEILTNLEERHIQIFLHDQKANLVISSLGWDGGAKSEDCGENCTNNWFGIVEANVGVNKANQFITRKAVLFSEVNEDKVNNKLTINFNNKAKLKNDSTKYKVYIRAIIPYKEIDQLVTVEAGEEKEVVFEWDLPRKKGLYKLLWRKQAGTDVDPVSVRVVFPQELLTGRKEYIYNTVLSRDFETEIGL